MTSSNGKACPGLALMWALTLLLSSSLLVQFPSGPLLPAVAQGSPQYADASNGLPTSALWTSDLRFFDLDGNGVQEALYLGPRKGNGEDRYLTVMEWDGAQWSNVSADYGTSAITHSSYGGLDLADLNGDDKWDVIAGSHGGYAVDAYLYDRANGWNLSNIRSGGSDHDAWSVEPGDFNADGYMDVLVGGFWGQDVVPFAGDGAGNWQALDNGLPRGWQRVEAHFSDVNRDGFLDVVASFGNGDWVYVGDGSGNWANASENLPQESLGFGSGVDQGDFNDDGLVDLVMSTTERTYAFEGNGHGNWTDRSAGLPATQYESLVLADLNNDDYDDIVGLTGGGLIELFLATGTGGWIKSQTTFQGNAQGHRVNVGDFDSNGHRDLLAGFGTDDVAGYPGSVRVWRETTNPTALKTYLDYPDGGEVLRGGSVQLITWLTADPIGSETRTVDLHLSTQGPDGPWSPIARDIPDRGVYQWQVPQVYSDECYIRVTVDDHQDHTDLDLSDEAFGINPPGLVNRPPSLEILEPSGDEDPVDLSFQLRWLAQDPDEPDELTLDLFWDNDSDASEGLTLVAENLTNGGRFDWNLSALLNGEVYPYFLLDDHNGSQVAAYGPALRIFHPPPNLPPVMTLLTPALPDQTADTGYEVRWLATDANLDELTISLFYDMDTDPDNGRQLLALGLDNSGSFSWDTTKVTEGDYYLCGLARDTQYTDYACSPFALTVHHPPPPPNEPPTLEVEVPSHGAEVDEGVLVRWTATDPQLDPLLVDLAYTGPGVSLPATLAQGLRSSLWFWDTAALRSGDYQLIASVSDGEFRVFDNTSLTIQHPDTADVGMSEGQYLLSPGRPREGDEITLTVFVTNHGTTSTTTTVSFILEEGPPVLLPPVELTLEGEQTQLATVSWTAEAGRYQILIEASSAGPADETADNSIVVTLEVAGTVNSVEGSDDHGRALILGTLGLLAVLALVGGLLLHRYRQAPLEGEEPQAGGHLIMTPGEAYPQVAPLQPAQRFPPADLVQPGPLPLPPEEEVEW